jgi:hypothetical protein
MKAQGSLRIIGKTSFDFSEKDAFSGLTRADLEQFTALQK